jgi:pSer/pThr/pTyr-binding forkhead associated (FHA) protein
MAYLKIMSGDQKGQKLTIDRDVIGIGRASDNVMAIDDPSISGHHCSVIREGRRFNLRDVGSTNGTRLNDIKITEYHLSAKDIFTAGSVDIQIDGDDIENNPAEIPPTIVQPAVRRDTVSANAVGQDATAGFTKKEDSNKLLIGIGLVVALFVIAALVWFFFVLFQQ